MGNDDLGSLSRMLMVYSLVAATVALAAIVGAWHLTKEALAREGRGSQPP